MSIQIQAGQCRFVRSLRIKLVTELHLPEYVDSLKYFKLKSPKYRRILTYLCTFHKISNGNYTPTVPNHSVGGDPQLFGLLLV